MPLDTLTDHSAAAGPDGSMAQVAYLHLRERLVMLDIAPGAPLNEQSLATDLGVGRTPLREAIKRLETEHFVQTFPRRGTFATRVDPTVLAEISEVRRALEPLAARRAARLVDADGRRRLDVLCSDLQDLGAHTSARTHMAMDVRMHTTVYSLARNAHLESALTHYLFLAMRIWCVALPRLDTVESHIAEHVEIIEHLRSGEEDASARLMLQHMDRFESTISRGL